jgi:hypothetical protein
MKNVLRRTFLILLCLLAGCGSTPLFLAGTWVFKISPTNSSSGAAIQLTVPLTQFNSSIFGTATLSGNGTSCGTVAMMSGTVSGSKLSLQLTQSENTLNLTGTATGGYPLTYTASGKYTATTGSCLQNGGGGTWTGFLEANNASNLHEEAP